MWGSFSKLYRFICLPHTVRVTVTFLVDLIYSVSVPNILIIYMSLCVIDVHRGQRVLSWYATLLPHDRMSGFAVNSLTHTHTYSTLVCT